MLWSEGHDKSKTRCHFPNLVFRIRPIGLIWILLGKTPSGSFNILPNCTTCERYSDTTEDFGYGLLTSVAENDESQRGSSSRFQINWRKLQIWSTNLWFQRRVVRIFQEMTIWQIPLGQQQLASLRNRVVSDNTHTHIFYVKLETTLLYLRARSLSYT